MEGFLLSKFILVVSYRLWHQKNLVTEQLNQILFLIRTITDPDQSIYGFRSAEPKNFQKMRDDFSDIGVINMEQNYRSTGKILKAALHVITQGKAKIQKHYITD